MAQYTRDEVEEILRRALETQPVEDLSHEDLLEVAEEAGIDKSLVEAAAKELAEKKIIEKEEETILARRKRNFFSSLYTYVATNGFLVLIDVMSGPGWWVQWVLAGWGLGIALAARSAFLPDREKLRTRALRRISKRRKPLDKAVKAAQRGDMEKAIEVGVQALVNAAVQKMNERHRYSRPGPPGHRRRRRVRVESPDVVEAEVIRGETDKHRMN